LQTTAQEVQNLLVSGRRKEALQHAQEGQLWGPALILALQLGDKVCCRIEIFTLVSWMACTFLFPELFLIVLLPDNAVLCGYCEENGSLPFCFRITLEDIVPSYCWTTCRCFQF